MNLTNIRFLTARGFGVHSPWAYNFILFVLRESLPYYPFAPLERLYHKISNSCQMVSYKPRQNERLFRIANFLQPSSVVEIGTGSGLSALYLSLVNASIHITTLSSGKDKCCNPISELQSVGNVVQIVGSMESNLMQAIKGSSVPTLFHIAFTDQYEEAFNILLPYLTTDSVVVVGGLEERARYSWWRSVVDNYCVGDTFEDGRMGVIFFDKRRYKYHYKI